MKEKPSAIFSEYIIDGIKQPLTPAQILDNDFIANGKAAKIPLNEMYAGTIMDESLDPIPAVYDFNNEKINEYIELLEQNRNKERVFPTIFSGAYTKSLLATTLINSIWKNGHFHIRDFRINAHWHWNDSVLGNMAAFYNSVEAAAEYINGLGIEIDSYSYDTCKDSLTVSFEVLKDFFREDDSEENNHKHYIEISARIPSKLINETESWIIYIPFDTCDYRLGGSKLFEIIGKTGIVATEIDNPEYFTDCYEIVRELVEDGIPLSGITVGEGGLISALNEYRTTETGLICNISDISKAYNEPEDIRILFSEMPGVLIQIRDSDYDYVDAELLLQDIAYFPIGKPQKDGRLEITKNETNNLLNILQSLIRS